MTSVLIIGYVWPEPSSSAAGTRMLDLIRVFLQQSWRVTFASPAAYTEQMIDLEAMGVRSVAIQLNDASFDRFISELQPDIVLFDRYMMEEQFGWRVEQHCPAALRILETVDLHFLRNARHHAVKTQSEVQRTELFGELAQREVAAIWRSDMSLIISEYEMQLLQQEFSVSAELLHYCPFMLDARVIEKPRPDFEQRAHFISIGNFRHAPNWDAVLWLHRDIWPKIHAALPQAQLHIYGAYMPPKASALHNPKQGFYMLGWAPSAEEVMQSAKVCLAPLRFGAGLKGKIADAMVCGTPNVTTDIGAESMSGGWPWSGAIANNADDIAVAAINLYKNNAAWQQAQANGFAIIKHVFATEKHSSELIARICKIREALEKHRLANFIGAMLRHHHHKSTQYMARWIETKNKLMKWEQGGVKSFNSFEQK